jgi:putative membrane protein
MMLDHQTFWEGAHNFLIAFGLAVLFLILFQFIYQITTPQDERKLIREGNSAAAIAFGGAIVGFALPVASALSVTGSIAEFAAWAALAGVVQIVAALIIRMIVIKDVRARIEAGEVATGVYLAAVAIAIGLINAASMTY